MFPWRMFMLPVRMAGWVTDGGLGRIAAPLEQNQIGRGQNWVKCFSAICQWRGETDWSYLCQPFAALPLLLFHLQSLLPAFPLSLCTSSALVPWPHGGQPWSCSWRLMGSIGVFKIRPSAFPPAQYLPAHVKYEWGFVVLAENTGSGQSMELPHKHTALLNSDSVTKGHLSGSVRVPDYHCNPCHWLLLLPECAFWENEKSYIFLQRKTSEEFGYFWVGERAT